MTDRGLDADVAVVGAGAAGLMAARTIVKAGLDVVVLEAQERAGGRILTLRRSDLPCAIELGAEFVHGKAPHTREILDEAGVEVASVESEAFQAREGRIGHSDSWGSIERVLGALDHDRDPDRSFAEFLRSPEAAQFGARDRERSLGFVEGFHAADPERVSERGLAGEGTGGAMSGGRIPAGYDRLVERLADGLVGRIRYGLVVKRIAWSDGDVRLSGSGFETRARAAVVAVPHAVLQAPAETAAAIEFDPVVLGLSEELDAVATGDVIRLMIVTDAPPHDLLGVPDRSFFLLTPACDFNAFWSAEPPDSPVLVAWSGGARSRRLPRSRDAQFEAAVGTLRETAGTGGETFARHARGAFSHDWRRDPFARGAYCYPVVGGGTLEPIHTGGLAFAGEAFAGKGIGTVEGALRTGRDAARGLLDRLK